MKIVALHRSSFVDYPGRVAAVIFTLGCNLNCFYCHNRALVEGSADLVTIPPSKVLGYLRKRRGLLDAVVITGGEPTLQSGLADFIREVRCMDYRVKLDTSGTHPAVLTSLMSAGLLDYVAMDIKAPPEKYDSICGVAVDLNAIDQSIDLLMGGSIDYEFRTTVVPQLTKADILAIGRRIRGARLYILQQYRRPECFAQPYDPRLNEAPRLLSWLSGVLRGLEGVVKRREVRGSWTAPPNRTERSNLILPQ